VRYEAHRPGPPLGDYVDRLWIVIGAPAHARERVLPTGTVDLIFGIDDAEGWIYDSSGRQIFGGRGPGAAVSGCYSSAFEYETRARGHVVGIHFKPGGAARLLGAPPGAFANAHVHLADLWGPSATELVERLSASRSSHHQFDLLEKALLARMSDRFLRRPAVTAALAELEQPRIEVGSVARMLGLSRRRFIEIFCEDVGMTPKRYSMVRRFHRALGLAAPSPTPAWSRIAAECGYYDQAHLCRDWLELTGLSPQEFVGQRGLAAKDNHVAVPDAEVKAVQYASEIRSSRRTLRSQR
jgi:AraC-like DNA-binding protein